MGKLKYLFFFLLVLLAGCAVSTNQTQTGLTEIRLPVGYIPNVQFAPLYVAMEKGYFADEGIHITLDYSFETDAVSLLGAGELQFAIVSGEQVLMARAQDVPVRYVMAWYQKFPVALASKAGHGMIKPADIQGKAIGVPVLSGASYIGLRAILDAGGLTEGDITMEVIGFNQVEMLATDRVDAVVVYVANEPVILANQGVSIDLIKVDDYRDLVSNGLVTNEKTISENPALVQGMVRAILRGIQSASDDPEEAFQISTKFVETLASADTNVQKQVLARSIELWRGPQLGYSDPDAWINMLSILQSMNLVKMDLDVNQAFTNDFLP